MRILQLLTYVAPGNPFGGPVAVAREQSAELRRRGHEVRVVAAQPSRRACGGWTSPDAEGCSSWQVLPGAGFSGRVAPSMLLRSRSLLRWADVVHVHMSRDLVTLPMAEVARLAGVPYVVQPHGMIDPSGRRSARVLDRLATRRVLSAARAVLVLTERERGDVGAVVAGVDDRTVVLPNGVSGVGELRPVPEGACRFVFCSRLHERKRPVAFVRAAAELRRRGVAAEFSVNGPDEGELPSVVAAAAAIADGSLTVGGALEPTQVGSVLEAAHVLVLPSVDEPFSMVVIEAMARGRAVVVSRSSGLASIVDAHGAGIVVDDDDPAGLVAAMERLALDRALMLRLGANAARAVADELSIAAVVDRLERVYESAMA